MSGEGGCAVVPIPCLFNSLALLHDYARGYGKGMGAQTRITVAEHLSVLLPSHPYTASLFHAPIPIPHTGNLFLDSSGGRWIGLWERL